MTIKNHTVYCHTDLVETQTELLSDEAFRLKAGAVAWVEGYFTQSEIIEALTDKYISLWGDDDDTYTLFTSEGEVYEKWDASDLIHFEIGHFDERFSTERDVLVEKERASEIESQTKPEYVQLEMGI